MKNFNRKSMLVITCIVLVLTVTVGGTLAYLHTTVGPLPNTFSPTHVTCEVSESFTDGDTTKSDVSIKNTSDVPAYLRAVIVGNWVKDGKIVAPWTDNIAYTAADWFTKTENGITYRYYSKVVAADGNTSELFDSYEPGTAPVEGAHLEMTIVCQAIQAEGKNTNGTWAVEDAWGVTVDDKGTNDVMDNTISE